MNVTSEFAMVDYLMSGVFMEKIEKKHFGRVRLENDVEDVVREENEGHQRVRHGRLPHERCFRGKNREKIFWA